MDLVHIIMSLFMTNYSILGFVDESWFMSLRGKVWRTCVWLWWEVYKCEFKESVMIMFRM